MHKYRNCQWCNKPLDSSGKKTKYCSIECKQKNREHYNALKRRYSDYGYEIGKYDTISLLKLYKRDGGLCYICGELLPDPQVNQDWDRADSPQIDHVIPIAKNGKNVWTNVKLICKKCNSKKGDKLLDEFFTKASN